MAIPVFGVMTGRIGGDHEAPYLLQAFWTMTAINFILLVSLAIGSVRLLQLKPRGVTICSSVFAAEILYFTLVAMLWFPFSAAFSMSIAGATGIGEMGIAPQVLSGYPLVALGALYFARKRLGALPPHKDLPIPTA